MADSDWRELISWAERAAASVDLDHEERNYKVKLGERVREVMPLVEADAPEWPGALTRAMRSNLIHYTSLGKFEDVATADRSGARKAVTALWKAGPTPEAAAAFYEYLHAKDPKIYIGAALAAGSILLLASHPDDAAPYKTEAVKKFTRLAGEELPDDYDAAARWQNFLDVTDRFLREGKEAGIELRDRLDAQGLLWVVARFDPSAVFSDPAVAREFGEWRADTPGTSRAIPRRTSDRPNVEDAGWAVLSAGLAGGPSPFDGKTVTWTAEAASELFRRFDEDVTADGSESTFTERFEQQLAGAPLAVYLLAAEFLFLDMLPLTNMRGDTKIERVTKVLEWSGSGVKLPVELRKGLEAGGAFNGGMGYSNQRWRHLMWLCAFVTRWGPSAKAAKERALSNPWDFMRALDGIEPDSAAMRYVLTYYAWPNVFPHIVSPDHRRRIRDAFAFEIGGATGKDDHAIARDLFDIRTVLDERAGASIDFYLVPYIEQWLRDKTRRAWFVNSQVEGASWDGWQAANVASLATPYLEGLAPGATEDSVAQAVALTHADETEEQRRRRTRELFTFLTRIKPDDLVITVSDGRLRGGDVGAAVSEDVGAEGDVRREANWYHQSVAIDQVPDAIASALNAPGRLVEVTSIVETLDELFSGGAVVDAPAATGFPAVSEELASRLHMPAASLQEYVDLLERRKQMVFYGPPGTGKTYLARELARHLAGADHLDAVTLVQFHPSYAYEDFFEGFRPAVDKGQAGFVLTKGPLARLADEARKPTNRDRSFFLIIDEMNRGNLAKVFGELYFLLEYRNQAVALQYSPETRFTLPPNLYIIGTMNTTDRSVGLVDSAIRRRFPFVELHPESSPVEGVLAAFLEAAGASPERAELLKALNARIDVRDLRVGPSYLMRPEAATEEGLRQIWDYDLIPLLAEHFHDRKDGDAIAQEFGLDAIRASLGGGGETEPVAEAPES